MRLREAQRRLVSGGLSAVIINREGEIVDVVSVCEPPTVAVVEDLEARYPGMGMRLLSARQYTKEDLTELIRDMLEAFALMDSGVLRPGVNLR